MMELKVSFFLVICCVFFVIICPTCLDARILEVYYPPPINGWIGNNKSNGRSQIGAHGSRPRHAGSATGDDPPGSVEMPPPAPEAGTSYEGVTSKGARVQRTTVNKCQTETVSFNGQTVQKQSCNHQESNGGSPPEYEQDSPISGNQGFPFYTPPQFGYNGYYSPYGTP